MAGNTGYTAPTNSSTFAPPADMAAIYAWFDDVETKQVSTKSALPASGNWNGRRVYVQDTHIGYVYMADVVIPGWYHDFGPPEVTAIPAYGANWTVTPSYFAEARVSKGEIILAGSIQNNAIFNSDADADYTIATVPSGLRPGAKDVRPFACTTTSGSGLAQNTVQADGEIYWHCLQTWSAPKNALVVHLDGIRYPHPGITG